MNIIQVGTNKTHIMMSSFILYNVICLLLWRKNEDNTNTAVKANVHQ